MRTFSFLDAFAAIMFVYLIWFLWQIGFFKKDKDDKPDSVNED